MTVKQEINELRTQLVDYLRSSFIGPENENEILSKGTRPSNIYLTGALYSRDALDGEDEIKKEETLELSSEYANLDDQSASESGDPVDEVSKDMLIYPVSCGLTFYCDQKLSSVNLTISYGTYNYIESANTFSRTPREHPINIKINDNSKMTLIENWVYLDIRVRIVKDAKVVTLTLINKSLKDSFKNQVGKKRGFLKDVSTIWQCKIKIDGIPVDGLKPINSLNTSSLDSEVESQVLLYRDVPVFAVGHNCSVQWEIKDGAANIFTEFLPEYELYLMKPSSIEGVNLNIKLFADIKSFEEQGLASLKALCDEYKKWIDNLSKINLPSSLNRIGQQHIKDCQNALARMINGLNILATNGQVKKSFINANKIIQLQNNWKSSAKFDWHPFQIGFFLLNLEGLVDPKSKDREISDLLWFPTGGGKTEAYLLISAFILVYRNLREESKETSGAGTAIILRYTLRLLTQQQLQRAARMICAAEHLRKASPEEFGKSHFSIGLWVGGDSFPNTNKDWVKKKDEGKAPLVFESCPCCNIQFGIKNYSVNELPLQNKKRSSFTKLNIKCLNTSCSYYNTALPIHLTDEDVYKFCPSILIGTVDKFAQVAWKEEAGKLFGIFDKHCNLHGYTFYDEVTCNCKQVAKIEGTPPELIIQDELHLITGPLGSMVGAFEIAVRNLCGRKGERVKYISSTATIRGASRQLSGLYNTESFQFPPAGIDSNNSFFAIQGSKEQGDYGRLYLGISAKGKSGKLVMARIYALLNHFYNHHYSEKTFSDEAMDYLRTVIGYFNSRKELGGVLSMMGDDVIKWRKFHYDIDMSKYDSNRPLEYPELKGGMSGDKVTKILNSLEIKNHSSPEFVLATNILSVGIDINRLFSMVIAGQPKTTSEYIQASSRVGRSVPGLVLINFNMARARDVSHYEKFISYHSQLYRYVEGISVTPLSPEVRRRTMVGILVCLVRHFIPEMRSDESARNYQQFKEQIHLIAKKICDSIPSNEYKEDFQRELDDILNNWNIRTKMDTSEFNYKAGSKTRGVMKPYGVHEVGAEYIANFVTSLRNVDEEVPLMLKGRMWS